MIYLLTIFVVVIITAFFYWFFIPRKGRNIFLLVISLFLIASYNVKYAVYFLFNASLVYQGSILLGKDGRIKKNLLKILLFWLIGNLCFFKYSQNIIDRILFFYPQCSLLSNAGFPVIFFPLGLSYIIFRLVHYIIETYRGSIPRGSFADFLLYIFFFPTFLAGPVERFERFHPQAISEKSLDLTDVNAALSRIVSGMIKKFIIADSLVRFLAPVFYAPQDHSRLIVVCALYASAVRIYMDFAGYTDIALGVSRLFGYKIMENFDRPFLKKNIALFWRSWHISVYSWIRDYFFFPLFGSRAGKTKLYLGIFITMVIFHLWHAASASLLLLGIYHGLGLIIWQLFQEAQRRQRLLRRIISHRWLNPFSAAFTFSFVSFGFIFFNTNIHNAFHIIKRICE